MLSKPNNGLVWMEGEEEEEETEEPTMGMNQNQNHVSVSNTFSSMLDTENWYMNSNTSANVVANQFHGDCYVKEMTMPFCANHNSVSDTLFVQQMGSTSNSIDPHQFLASKSCFNSLFNVAFNNPFDNIGSNSNDNNSNNNVFELGGENAFLAPNLNNNSSTLMGFTGLNSSSELFPVSENIESIGTEFYPTGYEGFDGCENGMFLNRPKAVRPLEVFAPVGAQPTLFHKRAALQQSSDGVDTMGNFGFSGTVDDEPGQIRACGNWGKRDDEGEMEGASLDISSLNYDSDENIENFMMDDSLLQTCGNNSNGNSSVTGGGDQKGKRKGLPAKTTILCFSISEFVLLINGSVAHFLLCSQMDRALILGDAIEYLKELLLRINDLHNELESTLAGSSLPNSTGSNILTSSPLTLPFRVKAELCPSSLSSPNSQPARIIC